MTPITLFCFPCAGASATSYLRWRRQVPPWLRIEPVEYPGRGLRMNASPLRSVDALVTDLCHGPLAKISGPFAFLGHSLGALLAYECTYFMRYRRRALPHCLFAVCSPSPSTRDPGPYRRDWTDEALTRELKIMNGTATEVFDHPELLRTALDQLATDFALCADFKNDAQRSPLPIPIHVIGGLQDDITAHSLEAWGNHTSVSGDITWVEGGHFFLRQDPSALLALVQSTLAFP